MLDFYQHLPFHINPIALSIGFFKIKWYSVMYLIGFVVVYLLLMYRIKHNEDCGLGNPKSEILNPKQIQNSKNQNSKIFRHLKFGHWNLFGNCLPASARPWQAGKLEIGNSETDKFLPNGKILLDLFIYSIVGLLIGARLGYVLFYNFSYYINHPLEIFLPIQVSGYGLQVTGIYGMSYFGGLIGIIIAGLIYARKYKINFWQLADFIVPAIPAGYFFGRIGNFLNRELYGRVTDKFWGMYFPTDPFVLRHPSQLYEAFFEGFILFIILWLLRNKSIVQGQMLIIYLFGYGVFRFFVEFFREPDPLRLGSLTEASPQIGMVFNFLTLGQVFSLIMLLFSGYLFFQLSKQKESI